MQEKLQNKSPIKQRILFFVDTLGISKRDFYKKIDVSRGTLESNSSITEEILAKVIANFGEISPNWLLTGEGDMLKSSPNVPSDHLTTIQPGTSPVQTDQSPGTGCPLCKDKDERIKDLKETIEILKENIKSLGNSFKISIETQQSVIHQLQDQIDDLQQQHFDTDDTITSQAG